MEHHINFVGDLNKMVTKKQKRKNKIITWVLFGLTAYVLLVNNSLEFLRNYGINAQENVIGVIMVFITLAYGLWKISAGEL